MADLGNIDTSMYGHQTPIKMPDILGMAHSYADTQNAFNQNAITQKTIRAKQAFGQIIQQTIGPDGQPDYAKAAVMMAGNPATAWAAPEFIHDMAVNKGLQIDNVTKGIEQAFRQQDAIAQTLAPLLAHGPDGLTMSMINGAAGQLVASGVLGPPAQATAAMMGVMKTLPQGGPALYQSVTDYVQRSRQTAGTLENVWGKLGEVDFGPGIGFLRMSPLTGVHPLGSIDKGLTPEGLNTPTEIKSQPGWKMPDGTPIPAGTSLMFRQGAVPGMPVLGQGGAGAVTSTGGVMGDAAGGASGDQGGGVGAAAVPGQGGALPPPVGAPNAARGSSAMTENPALTAGSAASVAQGGPSAPSGIPMNGGPPVSQVAPQTDVLNKDFGLRQAALQDSMDSQFPMILQQKAALKQMGPGGITTGGLANLRASIGQLMQGLGVFPPDVYNGVANGSLPGSQILDKITGTQSVTILKQLLGGEGRVAAQTINRMEQILPHIDTDPHAVVELFNFFAGLYTVQKEELRRMNEWDGRPQDFIPTWYQRLGSEKGQAWLDWVFNSENPALQPEIGKVKGVK